MPNSLFVSGNGLISRTSDRTFQLDLINLRDTFFVGSDYLYNILRWRRVAVTYSCSAPEVSGQRFQLIFDIPSGETVSSSVTTRLQQVFIGDPVLNKITIYDYDNGHKIFYRDDVLAQDASFNLPSDLPSRPVIPIVGENSLSSAMVSLSDVLLLSIDWKVQIKSGSVTYEPPLEITDINTGTGQVDFDQPAELIVSSTLVLASENGTRFEVTIDNDGQLTTDENNSATITTPFKILHLKDNEVDPDVFSRLFVSNEGVLFYDTESDSGIGANNFFYLKSPDDNAWRFSFTPNGVMQSISDVQTLIGKNIVFARNAVLTTEQLIDYRAV